MSLALQLEDLAEQLGKDYKTLVGSQGDLSTLPTEAKDNVVNAIAEIYSLLADAGIHIDDTAGAGQTNVVLSADKVVALLEEAKKAVKDDLLSGASEAYDTFKELQDRFEADEEGAAAVTAALGKRVRFDAPQTLTAEEQTTARNNIGAVAAADIGDTEVDLVAIYNAAKA
jgi:hypothetical protein